MLLPFLACTSSASVMQQNETGWWEMFGESGMDNFQQLNGKATYELVDGVLIGTSVPDEPNSFLATKDNYSDFILDVDIKVEGQLNSGIQIRSESIESYRDGRVHGYQVEIDPSERAWSGGIYDEARRGWLYNQAQNKACGDSFKLGEWNNYWIEAIGSSIRTWVNGVPCSNLKDDMTASGFIAFQVHGVGKHEDRIGKRIFWKNARLKTENLEVSKKLYGEELAEISYLKNQLTEREVAGGWELLFDGSSTEAWIGAKSTSFPDKGWSIVDGDLIVHASGGGESAHGGDIVTKKDYGNFELEVDFKMTEGANSGIKYFVDPQLNKGAGSAIGCEFQILDDNAHPDAKEGVLGNRTLGSLYDMIPAPENKRVNGIGNWNRARIVSKDGHVEHWLNNIKLLEYERGTPMWRALVNYSKYQKWPNFGEWDAGPILLQDHGDEVHFRNIKIREL